jgi:hypothetical protein
MRNLLFVMTLPLAVSCAGAGKAAPTVRPAGSETADREPRALVARDLKGGILRSLPPTATFAWVSPTEVFAGITAKEAAAEHAVAEEAKIDAAAVLRANGWREVPAESAQFRLSMVRTERTGQRTTFTPDPRNERRPPERCERGVSNIRNPCVEPAPPNHPPIRNVNTFTVHSLGYSIRRVSDGATAWWVSIAEPDEARNLMARKTVELLLAIEKYPQ